MMYTDSIKIQPTKKDILERLLGQNLITFEEMWVLMQVEKEIRFITVNDSQPANTPIQPYVPPYVPDQPKWPPYSPYVGDPPGWLSPTTTSNINATGICGKATTEDPSLFKDQPWCGSYVTGMVSPGTQPSPLSNYISGTCNTLITSLNRQKTFQ